MRFFLRSILTAILLLACTVVRAQDDWDRVLDRYESICKSLIEMRASIVNGEGVPDSQVTEMLGELGSLRSQLQQSSGRMTPAQRRRFNSIRSSYENNGNGKKVYNRPLSKAVAGTQEETAPADPRRQAMKLSHLPPIKGGPPPVKPLVERGLPEKSISAADMRRAPKSEFGAYRIDLLPVVDLNPKPVWGVIAALSKNRWGAYISVRSNFISTNTLYVTTSDGNIATGGKFWGNGNSRYGAYCVTGGAVWRPWGDSFGFLLGAGYGESCVARQDVNGDWARVYELSGSGLTAEAGLMYTWKHLSALAGLRIQKKPSVVLGLGYSF